MPSQPDHQVGGVGSLALIGAPAQADDSGGAAGGAVADPCPKSETQNPNPNPEIRIRNQKPETRNPKSETENLRPKPEGEIESGTRQSKPERCRLRSKPRQADDAGGAAGGPVADRCPKNESRTPKPEPKSRNPEGVTRNLKPETRNRNRNPNWKAGMKSKPKPNGQADDAGGAAGGPVAHRGLAPPRRPRAHRCRLLVSMYI